MDAAQQSAITTAVQRAEHWGIRHLRAFLSDASGLTRVKIVTRDHLIESMKDGIGLSTSLALINTADHLESTSHIALAVGEMRLMPDPSSLVPLPYAPGNGAVLVDMVELDGAPFPACPRTFLRDQVTRLAGLGLQARIGPENEWYFMRPGLDGAPEPPYVNPYYGAAALHTIGPILTEVIDALGAQGMDVAQYHPEAGQGQCEVSLAPRDPITTADKQVLLRETVKGVAQRHGLLATLAPKPYLTDIGSGSHVHLSLWSRDGACNAFYDESDRFKLSSLAYHFMAGMLDHLPALVALTCPTVNSYTRLQPGAWSSAFICWGFQNREAAVRAVHGLKGTEAESTNLELKTIDSSCNPYLALGGILAAGMDGIERELMPPEPLEIAPGALSEEERQRRGIRPFPATLSDALAALEQDGVLMDALGEVRSEAFLLAKRNEAAFFAEHDKEFELAYHRARF
jgi:glutamine synthetase